MPTTAFIPNFPPGGTIDDENNKKVIEALQNAEEYSVVDEEIALKKGSVLSTFLLLYVS